MQDEIKVFTMCSNPQCQSEFGFNLREEEQQIAKTIECPVCNKQLSNITGYSVALAMCFFPDSSIRLSSL